MTTFFTASPTERHGSRERALPQREAEQSFSPDPRLNEITPEGSDYFKAQLRNAVPLDRASEFEITSQIEELSRKRAELILGFPSVISEIISRVAHHIESKNQGEKVLRDERTLERLAQVTTSLKLDLAAVVDGALSGDEYRSRLDRVGEALASDAGLIATRIVSNSAIERYRRMVEHEGTQSTNHGTESNNERHLQTIIDERRLSLHSLEAARAPFIDRLISGNLRLVHAVAARFRAYGDRREELIAAGNLALSRCARDVKASMGFRFSTYAFKCIEREMVESLIERGRHGRNISLHHPIGSEDTGELIHLIPDQTTVDPKDAVATHDGAQHVRAVVARAMSTLPAEERIIVERYFGLDGSTTQPIRSIAHELGKSTEQIRIRLDRAKLRLRRALAAMEERSTPESDEDSKNPVAESSPSLQHIAPESLWGHPTPAPREQRASNASERAMRLRLPPSERLFTLTDDYTAELTRIRRNRTEGMLDLQSSEACLDEIHRLHEYLARVWPPNHPERRHGFQLEGEMLRLKKTLTTGQIADIEAAITTVRAGIEQLHRGS